MLIIKIAAVLFVMMSGAVDEAMAAKASGDLPVIVSRPKSDNSDKLIIFITGDGGWNTFSKQLADSYVKEGIPVVALNGLKYFWKKKSPQEAANDVASLITKYSAEWQKKKIVLCGYSFGADVTPFIYRRLPAHLKSKVVLLQLLSPASFTDFEIHISDLFGSKDPVRSMDILSELKSVDAPVICYYGSLEEEKPFQNQQKVGFKVSILPGDHHYKNSFSAIAKAATSK